MSDRIAIAGCAVGSGEPLFAIAEIGLNHGGSIDRALDLVDAAAFAGASAVKVQVMTAADLVTADCAPPSHVRATSLREFFAGFELGPHGYAEIARRARRHGLAFMGTPFSAAAVAMLHDIGTDAFKIASGDLTYDALIEACARTGQPLVFSTGASTVDEIARAARVAEAAGARDVALLHCVSAYPVPPGSENLRAITTLARFGCPVGLSDHSEDGSSLVPAVVLGASLYERHLELDGDLPVDHDVSSTAAEFAALVRAAASTRAALGDGRKECLAVEAGSRSGGRRGLRAARALRAGHVLTAADVVALRPAAAVPPSRQRDLVGARLGRDIGEGEAFRLEDLKEGRDRHEAA